MVLRTRFARVWDASVAFQCSELHSKWLDAAMARLPDIDASCGRYFTYRDLIECGDTWHRLNAIGQTIENRPLAKETWTSIRHLASKILDPVVEEFGPVTLTYGHAGAALTKHIPGGIAPRLDQHAGHELNSRGNPICGRLGQAADFYVEGAGTDEIARFIVTTTPFDRLYLYGVERPLVVSWSHSLTLEIVEMATTDGHRHPRRRWNRTTFLQQ